MHRTKVTQEAYGFLWEKVAEIGEVNRWHFNDMQEVIPEPIVRGSMGIDVGSGCGYDTCIMAKNNSSVSIITLEVSNGIYKTKRFISKLKNVWAIKGSVSDIPIKKNVFDFAYAFGVLHHISNPERGLREIARVIKPNAPVFLYLYEDHSENYLKYYSLKIVTVLRKITNRIPARALYIFSYLFSPFIVLFFSYPSRVLKRFEATRPISEKIPFNFGSHLFSLAGDLYDRFGAPLEHRFNRKAVFDLLDRNGFKDIKITRLKARAGWVVWGYKR